MLLALPQRGNPSRFAVQVSNPASPLYRRFLSLRQYDQRFAAGVADRGRVLRYLRSQPGVDSVQVSGDRSVILAVVTPLAAERLFCAEGEAQPTRGLCRPRAIRRPVRQISVGEVYQLHSSSPASGSVRSAAAGEPRRAARQRPGTEEYSSTAALDCLRGRTHAARARA